VTGKQEAGVLLQTWEAYSHTVAGRRESNEDGVLILPLGDDGYFFAVADGMGGIKGGEVASATVLDVAQEFLNRRFSSAVRADQLKKILRELYAAADAAVLKKQKENPLLAGMGTTLTCLLAKGDKFVIGNIGDSRIYRLTDARLTQITTDHTYVQEMITKTGLKPDAGLVKKFGHVVTRSIEGGKEKPDLFPGEKKFLTLKDGDGFLVCSDGLIIDKSADEESTLEEYFKEGASLQEAAERMVSFALDAGSSDNVSVVLATWGQFQRLPEKGKDSASKQVSTETRDAQSAQQTPSLLRSKAFISVLLFALLALVIIAAWRSLGQEEAVGEETVHMPAFASDAGSDRQEWKPFAAQVRRTYRLTDDFVWTPYPSKEVREYEICFGPIGPRIFDRPVCSLKSIDSLKRGIPYRVTVAALCQDGRRVTGASGIFVFR
jgi:serine/threonine protein phosphatase PrpC